MARTVFYLPSGEIYRISPYSTSQIRQLLAAGRHDQIEAVEEEFFGELLSDLARLLGSRLSMDLAVNSAQASCGDTDGKEHIVAVPSSGTLVISPGGRGIGADKDGLLWMKKVFTGKLVFVLDATHRLHG